MRHSGTLVLLLALCTAPFSAGWGTMSRSPTSDGQVLIFPYYSARGDAVTRFTVENSSDTAKTLSLRVLEGLNARRILGWNGYLLPGATQTYRIERDGDFVRVFHEDGGCTAPVFPEAGMQGLTFDLFDGGPIDFKRMQEGFVYVIATADLNGSALANLTVGDCATLSNRFNTGGPWFTSGDEDTLPATGRIAGHSRIDGLGPRPMELAPVGIREFTDDPIHNRPSSNQPTLNSGDTRVLVDGLTLEFETSVEALSALLLEQENLLPLYGDGTIWGAVYPTKPFFTFVNEAILPPPVEPFDTLMYDTSLGCEERVGITADAGDRQILFVCNVTNVLPLSAEVGDLDSMYLPTVPVGPFAVEDGYGILEYDVGDLVPEVGGLPGIPLVGIPVIPFSLRLPAANRTDFPIVPPVVLQPDDRFGEAIAGNGDALVITLPGANQVAAYGVRGRTLVQEGVLEVPDGFKAEGFGSVAAADDETLVIGAMPGAAGRKGDLLALQAAIYARTGQEWTYKATVESPPLAPGALFGTSIAVDGNTILVGAPGSGDGQAFLYDTGGNFVRSLDARGAVAGLGASMAIKQNIMAVGAPASSVFGSTTGAVSLYDRVSNNLITNAVAQGGQRNDAFGAAVSLSGQTMAVGAPSAEGAAGDDQGAVYIYDVDPMGKGSMMFETYRLQAPDGRPEDGFGTAVAVDGNRVAVGAPRALGVAGRTGAVYVFDVSVDPPFLVERHSPDDPTVRGFGSSVYLLEGLLASGAPESVEETGAAFALDDTDRIYFDSYES